MEIQGAYTVLVGGWATPLKNMKVNWNDDIPNIWENQKCSKAPTSVDVRNCPGPIVYPSATKMVGKNCQEMEVWLEDPSLALFPARFDYQMV